MYKVGNGGPTPTPDPIPAPTPEPQEYGERGCAADIRSSRVRYSNTRQTRSGNMGLENIHSMLREHGVTRETARKSYPHDAIGPGVRQLEPLVYARMLNGGIANAAPSTDVFVVA